MIDCMTLRDRMPDVAHGTDQWNGAEAAHVVACDGCAREWRLVTVGAGLHSTVRISADRVADGLLMRLRTEPVPIWRIPWRGSVIGLLAAAASVLIIVSAPRPDRARTGTGEDTTIVSLVPELRGLNDGQLKTVLQSLDPATSDVAVPAEATHLDDLTDAQLTKLLLAMGGE